jgi:hypothetical protein
MPILKRIISLAVISVAVIGLTGCSIKQDIQEKIQMSQYEKSLKEHKANIESLSLHRINSSGEFTNVTVYIDDYSSKNLVNIMEAFDNEKVLLEISDAQFLISVVTPVKESTKAHLPGLSSIKAIDSIFVAYSELGVEPNIFVQRTDLLTNDELNTIKKITETDFTDIQTEIMTDNLSFIWHTPVKSDDTYNTAPSECRLENALAIRESEKSEIDIHIEVYMNGKIGTTVGPITNDEVPVEYDFYIYNKGNKPNVTLDKEKIQSVLTCGNTLKFVN